MSSVELLVLGEVTSTSDPSSFIGPLTRRYILCVRNRFSCIAHRLRAISDSSVSLCGHDELGSYGWGSVLCEGKRCSPRQLSTEFNARQGGNETRGFEGIRVSVGERRNTVVRPSSVDIGLPFCRVGGMAIDREPVIVILDSKDSTCYGG